MKKIVMICLATLWLGCIGAVAVNMYNNGISNEEVDYEDKDSLCECDGMDVNCGNKSHK